jgi:hypothetical protein
MLVPEQIALCGEVQSHAMAGPGKAVGACMCGRASTRVGQAYLTPVRVVIIGKQHR